MVVKAISSADREPSLILSHLDPLHHYESPLIMSRILSIAAMALMLLSSLLCSAEDRAADIHITDGWVRASPPGARNAAAFLTLSNNGSLPETLLSVQCPPSIAERCEVHEHLHGANGMRMQKVGQLELPAGADIHFAPGGYHIMLIGLTSSLQAGSSVELVFTFATHTPYHAKLIVKPVHEE